MKSDRRREPVLAGAREHGAEGSPNGPDVVIIGAGVIGAGLAYELSKRGCSTLNLDALPSAGYGSTSCSSAIVRFSYSTLPGVAMAWEGLQYWRDWPE